MIKGLNKTIAETIGCSESLVSMILSGEREATNETHQKIVDAHFLLQAAIDDATITIKKSGA